MDKQTFAGVEPCQGLEALSNSCLLACLAEVQLAKVLAFDLLHIEVVNVRKWVSVDISGLGHFSLAIFVNANLTVVLTGNSKLCTVPSFHWKRSGQR